MKVNSTNTVETLLAKLILNSCYGFHGLNDLDTSSSIIVQLTGLEPEFLQDNKDLDVENPIPMLPVSDSIYISQTPNDKAISPYMGTTSVAIAAIITAEARMKMLPYRTNPRTLYTDTDSVIIEGSDPLFGMSIHDTRFGEFKLEQTVDDFVAIFRKGYAYITKGGTEVVKAAGIPKHILSHETVKKILYHNQVSVIEFKKLMDTADKLGKVIKTIQVTLRRKNQSSLKIFDSNGMWIETIPFFLTRSNDTEGKTRLITPSNKLILRHRTSSMLTSEELSVKTAISIGETTKYIYVPNRFEDVQ